MLWLAALEAYGIGDMQRAHELSRRAEELAAPMGLAQLHLISRQAFTPNFTDSALRGCAVAALRDDPELLERAGLNIADRARTYASCAGFLIQGVETVHWPSTSSARARKLALESENPTTLAAAHFADAQLKAIDAPDEALAAIDRCLDLYVQGAIVPGTGGALYISALLLAHRGDRSFAVARLHDAIELLARRGRTPELDGGFGYAIEILIELHAPKQLP